MSDVHAASSARGVEPPDGAAPTGGAGLRGRMGTAELVFAVLAFAGPLAVVSGVTPIVIAFGGIGAPAFFAVATIMLLLFAIALGTMSKFVPNAGGFYAYVTAGLGRRLGLGGGLLAIFSYWAIAVGSYVFLGSAISRLIADFGGPDIPWYACQWLGLLTIGVFGYLNIELSAKVLSVVMVLEVLVIIVFDVAVAALGGADGLSLAPLNPQVLTGGNAGVALLFAAFCFLGFESTAIYREEARNPEKTIPRAMWLSVALIGLFYVLGALMLILALGQDHALSMATDDPSAMLSTALETYVGTPAVHIVAVLLATSVFASMLSVQNMLSRYLYSLGRDRVLPARLGATHPRHRSPSAASMFVTAAILAASIPFAFVGGDEMILYGRISGVGIYAIMVLMLMASIAVVVYFRRQSAPGASVWQTTVIPIAASIGLAAAVVLATTNFDIMTGISGTAITAFLIVMTLAIIPGGAALATYLRKHRPQAYDQIGRQKG